MLVLVLGGLAILGGGLFAGSQIDDMLDNDIIIENAVIPEKSNASNLVMYAAIAGGTILALKYGKKLLK